MGERTRRRAEEALAEARRLLAASDAHAALAPLERARQTFVREAQLDRMRELRLVAEDGYRASEHDDEPAYERLLYASGQNVRFLSRRRAAAAKVPWEDPHPELDAPGRPEIRAERGVSRRDVRWIVVAAILGAAAVAGVIVALVFVYRTQRVELVNDTGQTVRIGICRHRSCDAVTGVVTLDPGDRYTALGRDFRVTTPSGRTLGCIHAHGATRAVSSATPCELATTPSV